MYAVVVAVEELVKSYTEMDYLQLLLHFWYASYYIIYDMMKIGSGVLPLRLCANECNTWAHDTMTRRILNDIIPRIESDNADIIASSMSISESLAELKCSLMSGADGQLTPLHDSAPDRADWDAILEGIPTADRNWLDSPWIIAEFYLYRRIVSSFSYFSSLYDPFKVQKRNGTLAALAQVEDLSILLQNSNMSSSCQLGDYVLFGLLTSLWGNKKDLSLWPAKDDDADTRSLVVSPTIAVALSHLRSNTYAKILDNQLNYVVDFIVRGTCGAPSERNIGIVVDNAGFELTCDLILGHILLTTGAATTITYHTKKHPTFVSDATTQDCIDTMVQLSDPSFGRICRSASVDMAANWQQHYRSSRFIFKDDFFWCQPTAFSDMPLRIKDLLALNYITIIKGDANYRRLLDDRAWPFDTPSAQVLSYWAVPMCALRTLKCEVACGISQKEQRRARESDEKWLVSGEWAVVQGHLV